jgi:hypothetical protein
VLTRFRDKVILLTAGTGSAGRVYTRCPLRDDNFRALPVSSGDEQDRTERWEGASACRTASVVPATTTRRGSALKSPTK